MAEEPKKLDKALAAKIIGLIVNGGDHQTVSYINQDGKRVDVEDITRGGILNAQDLKKYMPDLAEIAAHECVSKDLASKIDDLVKMGQRPPVPERSVEYSRLLQQKIKAINEQLKREGRAGVAPGADKNKEEGVKDRYTADEYAKLSQSMKDQIAMDYMDKKLNGGTFTHPVTGATLAAGGSLDTLPSKEEFEKIMATMKELGVSEKSNPMMKAMKTVMSEGPQTMQQIRGMLKACHEVDKNFRDGRNDVDALNVRLDQDNGVATITGGGFGLNQGVSVKPIGQVDRIEGRC
jgi:hypothetical protein